MTSRIASFLLRLRTSSSFRDSEKLGVVFGFTQLEMLLGSEYAPFLQEIFFSGQKFPLPLPSSLPLTSIAPSSLSAASGLEAMPKTYCAVVFRLPPARAASHLLATSSRTLILDRLSDPGNLGTVLRTCDALGWSALLSTGCVDPYNDKVLRAGCGATFTCKWAWLRDGGGISGPDAVDIADLEAPAAASEQRRVLTVLALPKVDAELSSIPAAAFDAVRLVIGSESLGLSQSWVEYSPQRLGSVTQRARIGTAQGVLNAAVAAAIGMYALGQRK